MRFLDTATDGSSDSNDPVEPSALLVPVARHPQTGIGRQWLALLFRHRQLILLSFLAVFIGALAVTLSAPPRYQAELKILVKNERPDPVVTAGDPVAPRAPAGAISEQELNAEVDLLQSRDLLMKVVQENRLNAAGKRGSLFSRLFGSSGQEPQQHTAAAVQSLAENLQVSVMDKSNLIRVRYASVDPEKAARVLNSLSAHYIEKHLEVRRTPGTSKFFAEQAEQYREDLGEAQARLLEFGRAEGTVAADTEKTAVLQRIADFEAALQQTEASIASTRQRLATLERQLASTPQRRVTQVRTSARVLEDLNATLYKLELQRAELLQKYVPTYRAVRDVDQQIAATRNAIADAQKNPSREETTDEDATHLWLTAETAKARSELAALRGQAASMRRTIEAYRSNALELNDKEQRQQELTRAAKTAEENYLLYARKHEEARMTEELDKHRFLNVAVAEPATVPALPSSSLTAKVLLAFALALLVSLGLGFMADYLDPSFRTPAEVEQYLHVPVLAALPRTQYLLPFAASRGPEQRLERGGS